MSDIHILDPDDFDGLADGERILNHEPWDCRLFCSECRKPWTGRAPCTHCGYFARPQVLTCRRVLVGVAWKPWTWRREYQYREGALSSEDDGQAEGDEETMTGPRAVSAR